MEWYYSALLMLSSLIVLVLAGLPIAVSLAMVSAASLYFAVGLERMLSIIGGEAFGFWGSTGLLAIPLFVIMAELLVFSGAAQDIFDVAAKWFRGLPGGLAVVAVVSGTIFATLCGSSLAGIATIGVLAVPQMLQRGYSRKLAAGSVAAAGGLAHIIPPSALMIIYAVIAEQSVGKMFIAGFIPGLMMAGGFVAVIVLWVLKNPLSAPREEAPTWMERLIVLRKAIAPVIIILAVGASIYFGITTVTEAAAVGAVAALVVSAASRKLTMEALHKSLLAAARTTCFILLIGLGGVMFSWVLTYLNVPQQLVAGIKGSGLNPLGVIIAIQVLYLALGAVLDPIGMIYVTLPVVLPVVTGLGFDPVWFGILLMINIEFAMITPPVGIGLYVTQGIMPKDMRLTQILHATVPFLIVDAVVMGLILAFPQIALWLPNQAFR